MLKLLVALGLTAISAFFSGVAVRASRLFHLVTNSTSSWTYVYENNLRLEALKEFSIAAIALSTALAIMHYWVQPKYWQKVLLTVLWLGIFGWSTYLSPE